MQWRRTRGERLSTGTDWTWKRNKVGQKRNEGSLTSWWGSYQPCAEMVFHLPYVRMWAQWIDVVCVWGGFLLCPSIHLSICFSALSSIHHRQVFPVLLHPFRFSPYHYSCFLQFLNPFCPSVCWTAVSQKAAHPPSRFSIQRTWRWTTESIKWCEERHNGFTKALMSEKSLWMMKGFLDLYDTCHEMDMSNATLQPMFSSASHFYCSFHFNQGFHTIPTSSHPPPLQSVLLPVTLILLWRLLAG